MKAPQYTNRKESSPSLRRPDLFSILLIVAMLNNNFVLINAVKGVTPGNVLALLAPIAALVIHRRSFTMCYFRRLAMVWGGFAILVVVSVFGGIAHGSGHFTGLTYINSAEVLGLRISILTQSLYMACALSFFVWVWTFYQRSWDKYIAASLWLCLAYGFFLWLGFIITGRDLDFLSNRIYGSGDFVEGGNQTIEIFGQIILRFVSYPGEPSVFAFVMVPAGWWAFYTGRSALALCIFSALLLSESTTAYIGILGCTFLALLRRPSWSSITPTLFVVAAVILFALSPQMRELLVERHMHKLSAAEGDAGSGGERLASLLDSCRAFMAMNPFTMLFGIGFGSVRELSIFQTFLINIGLFGLVLFFGIYLCAIVRARRSRYNWPVLGAALLTLLTLLLSVPEFSYFPQWLWLGMIFSGRTASNADPLMVSTLATSPIEFKNPRL